MQTINKCAMMICGCVVLMLPAAAFGQTYQENLYGLTYTMQVNTYSCPIGSPYGPYEPIYSYSYNNFAENGVTLYGGTAYLVSPGGMYCPPNGPAGPNPAQLQDSTGNTIILFYPCANNNGCYDTQESVGIMYPLYQIQSVIYAPPGNRSSNGFTSSTTNGTTTSVSNNFQSGDTISFSLSDGFLGIGSTISWSYGFSTTSGSSSSTSSTISQASGVANASNSSNPNTIDHTQDLFVLWLNPAVKFIQTGETSAVYSLGTQLQKTGDPNPGNPEVQDQVEVTAKDMIGTGGVTTVPVSILVPQINNGETLPGLAAICAAPVYYPNSCTQANQCGCTPSDFTSIIAADPLIHYNGTESPLDADTSGVECTNPSSSDKCRYVPIMVSNGSGIQATALLAGPECDGCNFPTNTFDQTDSTQTSQTFSEGFSNTVGYSWQQKWTPFGTGLTFGSNSQFTWSNSESSGTMNGRSNSMSVTLSSGTVDCFEDVNIFEDTVFHTFVFQEPSDNSSCP